MLLIGSAAAHVWHPYAWPHPADVDLVATMEEVHNLPFPTTPIGPNKLAGEYMGTMVEVDIAWPGSTSDALLTAPGCNVNTTRALGMPASLPTMDWLFTVKASHRYRKDYRHFAKTLNDYHLMRALGCRVVDPDWLAQRERETYTKPRPKLNVTKDDFFVDAYEYDHDSIHRAMAHLGQPAYEFYKGDGEVMCSRKKWDACPEPTRLFGVLEEAYVLALERSQIPHPGKLTPRQSFLIALEKVCTSVTSGWFREFAYNNYFKVLSMYSDDYVDRFNKGLRNGTVRQANGH